MIALFFRRHHRKKSKNRVGYEISGLGRSSDGAWLKTTRARRATASLHQFFIAGSGESAAGLISRLFSVQLGILLPFFSERSLEVRHSAWDRDHACANPAAPTNFYQVCGSVSGAPAREAGEAGAIPAHLTTARGDEVVESTLCRREVSRCESDHERQFVEVSPSPEISYAKRRPGVIPA